MAETAARVLIAETDETLRRAMYSRLLDLNVFADTATSASHALDCVRDQSYAVLILDIAVPGIEQVFDAVRKIEHAKRPLVLITTTTVPDGGTFDTDVVQIVLRKPFSVKHLGELVFNCVKRAQTSAAASASAGDAAAIPTPPQPRE